LFENTPSTSLFVVLTAQVLDQESHILDETQVDEGPSAMLHSQQDRNSPS
jgi:hypothetical protein